MIDDRKYNYTKKGSIKGVEVRGEVILGVLEAMARTVLREISTKNALELLGKCGISEIKQGCWYPLESFISALNQISKEGRANTLKLIGASVVNIAKWPNINTLSEALYSLDVSYHMNHRRDGKELFDSKNGKIIEGKIGHCMIIPPKKGENKVVYINSSFYPCDFDFGMTSELVKKFKPKNCNHFAISRHDIGECKSP
ncbi:MAG: hypothetical protein BWK80_29750 [Desulfobacteraceae bacterium IS3]|nr:MAG: hypothetical protein BWK80_29750 [Desulfobacteraceae bacterium IS3]